MKVIIDILPLKTTHKTRGIGIYTRRLVEAIRAFDKNNQYLLTTKAQYFTDADLVHYPYFDLFFHTLPLRKKTVTVVTIHDLIPLVFPQYFPVGYKGKLRLFLQKLALSKVDAVITDSLASKKDIIRLLGFPPEKIEVIYLAASSDFKPLDKPTVEKIRGKFKLPGQYLLYVGDVNENKNLPKLVEAFKLLQKPFPRLHLVMVGKAFAQEELKQVRKLKNLIREKGMQDQVIYLTTIPLDPAGELAAVYNGASVYVQPSLYEGFGLPVLEAMACGTPVVAADVASLPEIAGGAALLVNPESAKSLAAGIGKILNLKPAKRQRLIAKGLQQAGKFTWKETARRTIAVYKKVCARNEKKL